MWYSSSLLGNSWNSNLSARSLSKRRVWSETCVCCVLVEWTCNEWAHWRMGEAHWHTSFFATTVYSKTYRRNLFRQFPRTCLHNGKQWTLVGSFVRALESQWTTVCITWSSLKHSVERWWTLDQTIAFIDCQISTLRLVNNIVGLILDRRVLAFKQLLKQQLPYNEILSFNLISLFFSVWIHIMPIFMPKIEQHHAEATEATPWKYEIIVAQGTTLSWNCCQVVGVDEPECEKW